MCINNSKNNKAPGENMITNIFIKNLPSNWILYVNNLFNKILEKETTPDQWSNSIVKMLYKKKGEKTDPANYRPIALLNAIVKIFTSVLSCRITEWCNKNNLIPEWQAGFRKNRACLDNIFVLNSIIQLRVKRSKGKLYAAFVDFKSAFPSVNHQLLWEKLRRKGLSTKIINILNHLYNGVSASMRVRTNEGLSDNERCIAG